MTQKVTDIQARDQLDNLLDRATDDREIVIITRQDREPAALISTEALSSLLETAHLLRSPDNAQDLLFELNRVLGHTDRPTTVANLRTQAGLDR